MSHKKDKIRNISKSNREALKKDFIKKASSDISQKIITSEKLTTGYYIEAKK